MDSKVVNKAISERIKPFLKENGFTEFTSRNAWRYREERIEVINFQSFNSYLADGLGCTTYSFAINLGIYFKCFEKTPWFDRNALTKPAEYECHVREDLEKGIKQAKLFHPYGANPSSFGWEKEREDIWFVKEDGCNLDEVITDAKNSINHEGLKFFEDKSDLLAVIKYHEQDAKKRGMSWIAADMISTLSLDLGDIDKAIKACESAMNQYLERFKLTMELRKKYKNKFNDPHPYEKAEKRLDILRKLHQSK